MLAIGISTSGNDLYTWSREVANKDQDNAQKVADFLEVEAEMEPEQILLIHNDDVINHWQGGKHYN